MKECIEYQGLISRMIYEDLRPEEKSLLDKHLNSCRECRALYEAFSALSDAVYDQLEEAPESIRENVMAQLRRDEIKKNNAAPKRKLVKRYIAAAACFILVAGAALGLGPRLDASKHTAADTASGSTEMARAYEESAAAPEAFMITEDASPAEAAPAEIAEGALDEELSASITVENSEPITEEAAADEEVVQTKNAQRPTELKMSFVEFMQIIGGENSELSQEELEPYLVYTLSLNEGSERVSVYVYEDQLLYCAEGSGSFIKATCSPEEFKSYFNYGTLY